MMKAGEFTVEPIAETAEYPVDNTAVAAVGSVTTICVSVQLVMVGRKPTFPPFPR